MMKQPEAGLYRAATLSCDPLVHFATPYQWSIWEFGWRLQKVVVDKIIKTYNDEKRK